MQIASNSVSPSKNARWGATSLVLISLVIACLVLFNHYPVEVSKEVSNAGVSSSQFAELAGGRGLGQDENRHGGHRGKRKGKGHGHGSKNPTPVTEVGNEKPDNEHHGPVQIDRTEIGNDQPDQVGNPKRPEGPLPVHKGKPTKHVPHNPPDPVEATNTACYKVSTASVNVRDGPCGSVITSLSQGTVVTAVGSPQSKSPCSVGSFQWQQISGAANGWVANSLLTATSCPSPPSPPPTTTACYTPTQNGVNVRSSPCGSVVTQVNSGTVLHGVGAASSASSCSLGSYQWQQVSGAVSGYIATTYLKSVSCSTPIVTPPTNPPASGNYKGRGVDVSQPCGNWQCIKDAGYTFAIPRIYMESGHVDPNGAASVRAAAAVGLSTDVYVYPAGFQSNNGAQMANDVIAAIRGLPVGRVWLDIEGVGKSWPSSTASNQKLFKDLADTLTHAGISVGVYTQGWQWNSIMGSSFTYGSSFPLWYAEYGQGPGSYSTSDGTCQYSGSSQNFNGFSSFGGWSHPFAKQYNGDCSKCGCGTDASIVP